MKITIITITYNCQFSIEKTILSVIDQPVDNIEYILIDGLSTDKTMDIVLKYKNFFTKIISEKDEGISDAFNKGINLATGDIIGLINAGDILLPKAALLLNDNYENGIDIFYGDTMINDLVNNEKYIRKCKPLNNFDFELPFVHQSCFVSKKSYEKWGYYSNIYKYCMDYELLLRMYKNGARFKYINSSVSEFTYDGISYKQPFKTLSENLFIAQMHGLDKLKAFRFKFRYTFNVIIKRTLTWIGVWKVFSKILHN